MTWTLLCLSLAFASDDGKTGKSQTGCNNCHGATAAASTDATLVVDDFVVQAEETITVDFIVSTTNSAHTIAGLNVSATAGDLTAGSNNIVSKGEITHSRPIDMVNSEVVFTFEWTAPATNGVVTLFGAGNAADDNGQKSGDGWAVADPIEITVEGGETVDTGLPEDTGTPDTDDGEKESDTGEKDATGSGCNTSPNPVHWYGWLAVLAILGLSRRHTEAAKQRVKRVQQRPQR